MYNLYIKIREYLFTLRIDYSLKTVYNNIKLRVNHSEIKTKGLDIMLKWFKQCATVKEAKSQYHKLCRQYHPDMSGEDTTAIMQEIKLKAIPNLTKIFSDKKLNSASRFRNGAMISREMNCLLAT